MLRTNFWHFCLEMRQFLKPVELFGGFAQKMSRFPQPTQIFRDDQQVDGWVTGSKGEAASELVAHWPIMVICVGHVGF